jgi:hypothetical protein
LIKQQSRRNLTEHWVFLAGGFVASLSTGGGIAMLGMAALPIDISTVFLFIESAAIVGMLMLTVVEFETDGLISWILGGGVKSPRPGLAFPLGLVMKGMAIIHSVAALSFGSLLVIESDNLPARFSSGPSGMGLELRLAFVVWLWLVTVWAYLAGDGWIRRSRRADNPDGAGLK